MKWSVLFLVLAVGTAGWAQSLGEIARADRERSKPHASKVITNDDLRRFHGEEDTGFSPDAYDELLHLRVVLRQICSDPKSDHGRNLSDYDQQSLTDAVQPLRARVSEFERKVQEHKDALAALDREIGAELQKTIGAEPDLPRAKSARGELDLRRAALLKDAEIDLKGFTALQKELGSIGKECPEAANTVPDE